jgi:hypothetical protein
MSPDTLRHVFGVEQRAAVAAAFSRAGYDGPLNVAPVTSEDERAFLVPLETFGSLDDRTGLERALQRVLGRKVWVVAQAEQWADLIAFD